MYVCYMTGSGPGELQRNEIKHLHYMLHFAAALNCTHSDLVTYANYYVCMYVRTSLRVLCHPHTYWDTHVQADYFFVPPLEFLSEKLRLPDNISGITLLAIGNGESQLVQGINDCPLPCSNVLKADGCGWLLGHLDTALLSPGPTNAEVRSSAPLLYQQRIDEQQHNC